MYGHRKAPESLGIVATYQPASELPPRNVRILVFFETWCPFCLQNMAFVEDVNRQYRDSGVEVIGLTTASGDTPDGKVHKFISDNEMTFGVFKDNGRLMNYFWFEGIPSTVILHDGEVVLKIVGAGRIDIRVMEGLVSAKWSVLPGIPQLIGALVLLTSSVFNILLPIHKGDDRRVGDEAALPAARESGDHSPH